MSSIVKISHGLVLAAALLPAAIHAAAGDSAVVDDFEAGTNQNKFLAYSFYYDDSKDGGNSVVNSAVKDGTELKFDGTKSIGEGAGGSTKSAKLDFTFGSTKPTCGTGCTYGYMAGFGTGFIEEPKDGSIVSVNMTGATSISFMAKANAAMVMRVEIATASVLDFGYHLFQATLSTSWQTFTIPLVEGPGFAQPAWADPVPFDVTKMQKIQFAISSDDNAALTAGTVLIDNIVVQGYKWVPPSACMICVDKVGTGALLSDMETAPKNKNSSGGFWFAYNDAEGRAVTSPTEYSEIYEGVTANATEPTKPTLTIGPDKGAGGTSGAYIGFKLGPTYTQGAEIIKPFVGVGTKVSDNLDVTFTNWSATTGLSFSYWTKATSTFQYIRFEAVGNQTFGNAGAVYNVLLPATAGAWKTAVVKWTDLKLPTWEGVVAAPLKLAEMAKFQWAVQSEPLTDGAIAIDNVKCEGATVCPALATGSIRNASAAQGRGFSAIQGLNGIQVSLNLTELQSKASLRLLDLKGQVMDQGVVSGKGLQIANLGKSDLKSGVYTVQIKMGEKVMTSAVTVLP